MTDTFLDDQQVHDLTTALTLIADQSAELLRIARRETTPPGGTIEQKRRAFSSQPPLRLGALSVSHELHTCLTGWTRCLLDDALVEYPADLDDRGVAHHLRRHVHRIAQQPWAADCAEEIGHWAEVVRSATIPPKVLRRDDYSQAQRNEAIAVAKVSAAMAADLVHDLTDGEHSPTPEEITKWAQGRRIECFGPRHMRTYSLAQVLAYAKRPKRRVDKPC